MTARLLAGDCRDILPTLPGDSVHCCVTSPPYYGLRDYGTAGQIGIEASPAEYVAELVAIFREVRRVLRPDGTLWLNLGDSYAGAAPVKWRPGNPDKNHGVSNRDGIGRVTGCKPKDMIGIPWMVAFALRADGWYLRQDIIWSKPNPMPESVTDRCTKAHEYLFLLSNSERYWFDAAAIAEPVAQSSLDRWAQNIDNQQGSNRVPGKTNGPMKAVGGGRIIGRGVHGSSQARGDDRSNIGGFPNYDGTRNKRSVWTVTTQPFSEAHFATFPPALIEPCILAGCPAGGVVLDPFGGAGTTGLVADRLQRNALLIELNPAYCGMTTARITADAPLFAQVEAPFMSMKAKAKAKVKPPQPTLYYTAVLRQMAVSKSPLIKTFDSKLGRVTWGLNNGREVTDACARALIRNGWVVPVKDGMYDVAQTYVLPTNALRPSR